MDRRIFLINTLVGSLAMTRIGRSKPFRYQHTTEPIRLGNQKQLFLDDSILESVDPGMFLIMNQPLKYAGNPVIEMDRCWEADMHFGNASNVIYDQEEKRFKAWHQVVNYNWSESYLAYYESVDGIHWQKPAVGQFDYHSSNCKGKPSRNHNFVHGPAVMSQPERPTSHGVFKDLHETDPNKRYKMLYQWGSMGQARQKHPHSGTWAAYSPDGIQWTDYPYPSVNPVFVTNDTQQVVFWDPSRSQYVCHMRLWPPVYKNRKQFKAGKYSETHESGLVRVPGIATSMDFVNWDAAKEIYGVPNEKYVLITPDDKDLPAVAGFYSFQVLLYEGVYIGFLPFYHIYPGMETTVPPQGDSSRMPWMDTIDIHLAFSRDGRTWWRSPERRPFLVNGTRGSYDAGMIFVSQHPIVRKDLGEIWIYYVGAEKGHWAVSRGENQQSSICLAKIRLDGFVSLTAGKTATATTKPIILDGNQLILNAATAGREGEMGVEIIDVETGEPIPGFTLNDCDRFHGDDIEHVVTWNGNDNIGSLTNKPIKLCFELKRAKLFSFQCV